MARQVEGSSPAENADAAETESRCEGATSTALDELFAAKRSGDFERMQHAAERLLRDSPADCSEGVAEDAKKRLGNALSAVNTSPLAQYDRVAKVAYDKSVAENRAALARSFSSPTAAETILLDLVARELPISFSIMSAQQKLAGRLVADPILANATWVRALAQALRDVTAVNNSITRRVEGLLGAAANLRAQRRLLDGPNDK